MATVAELRMDVDSRPVKNAGRDLDQLASKAERTERATNRLGDGSRRAGRGVADLAHQAQGAGRSVGGMEAAIGRTIGRLAGFAAGIIGVVGALRGLTAGLNAADNFRALDNRIKLVTDSAEEFAKVQTGLIDISRRTFASVEGTVQAYQRMAGATDRLGISQDRLLGIAETVNKAVALSGATSQAAEASLIQFGQALSNNFQASSQEINSLNEQVFALSDAIARGITKVTGIETFRSDLKRLAEDGKLSSELVIRALEAVKDETDETFNGLDRTFAQVAQRIKTNAQVISKEAFGPLLNIKIDFATKLAAALEDPKTIAAATRFGATLADLAKGVVANADKIGKAFQGIAAGGGLLIAIGAVNALRAAVIALGVAAASNPLGLLVVGIAAAVASIVTFRDEITRALTPFKSFKELAAEAGPVFRGAFAFIADAAREVLGVIIAIDERFKSLISSADKKKAESQGLFSKLGGIARATSPFPDLIPNAIGALKARGLAEAANDNAARAAAQLSSQLKTASGHATTLDAVMKRFGKTVVDTAKPVGEVQKSLALSVSDAKRLFEAAKGGQLRLDDVSRAIEIEHAAIAAVEKAADAGEALSLAAATSLLTKARELQEGAKAFIEAEKALRERAKAKSGEIADSVQRQIDRSLGIAGDVNLNGLNSADLFKVAAQFQKTIQDQLDFLSSDATIGIDADTLLELQKRIKEAGQDHADAIAAAMKDGALRFRTAVQNVFGSIFDDLLFNAGRGIGGILKNLGRDVIRQNIIDPISKAFSGEGGIVSNIKSAFNDFSSKFKTLFGTGRTAQLAGTALGGAAAGLGGFQIGSGLSNLFGLQKGSLGRGVLTGAATGAAIGSIIPGIGTLIGGAIGALVGGIKSLFSGKASDNAAGGGVNFRSFSPENQFAKNNDPETIAARDQLLQATSSLAKTLADLTGSTLSGSGISIQVGKRNGTRIISAAGGDVTTPVGNAQAALDEIFRQLVVSLRGGEKALVDYVKAAQAAKRAPDAVIEGLQALKNIFDLTKEPLSNVAQALKQIDDAVNPVIEDLKSLGQSIAGIQKIAKDAAKAVGEAFLKDIRNLNIDLQNTVFGQFNRLLEEIRQREADASLLLGKGAITQQQFGFVQSTSGLQVSKFFEGLSDDDKESLADFLGLLKTASGDIAVARVKLEEQFDYLIDNVEETARNFEDAARTFERLAQNLTQTADSIRTEFSGLTPRDNTVTLQGRVQALLSQARDGTASTESRQSALEALPQVVNSLVQSARQAFGGTEQFAAIRDFGLSALDEGGTIADALAKFNQQQADAAREDVKLLTDIRELINDDRQLPTLQAILDEGRLTNTLIAQQLQTFLNLMATAGSNINQITAEELQAAAAAYLSQQQSSIASSSSFTQSASSQPIGAPIQSSTATDQQLAQALADQAAATDKNSAAILRMEQTIDDLATEIRRTTLRTAA